MMSERSDEPTTSASSAASMIRHLLERYRLPGFDLEALQADIDAISRATAVAFTGAQTITETQVDLLKAALDELNATLSSRSTAPGDSASVQEVAKKQRDLVQSTLTRTLEGMKEMAEAARRAQREIFDIGFERVTQQRGTAESLVRLPEEIVPRSTGIRGVAGAADHAAATHHPGAGEWPDSTTEREIAMGLTDDLKAAAEKAKDAAGKAIDNVKDAASEAAHRTAAAAEEAKRKVAGDQMTPTEQLGSVANQAKHTVQAQADSDATNRDMRTNV
jgi:phasin family protein